MCRAFSGLDGLEFCDAARPVPDPGQVTIATHACGVNFPDTLITEGRYQVRPPLPFSPGGEVAGQVIALGEGVETLRIGDRVMSLCIYGGYAEEAVIDAQTAVRIPDGLSYAMAASAYVSHGTSLHALSQRAQLQAGETLLVFGASGAVGLAAIRIGKMLGARVIALTSSAERAQACLSEGADHALSCAVGELPAAVTGLLGGPRVDVVLDVLGDAYTAAALECMAIGGRIVILGFAAGDIPALPLDGLQNAEVTIVGAFLGGFMKNNPAGYGALMQELSMLFLSDALKPRLDAQFCFEDTKAVLSAIGARRLTGKGVIIMPIEQAASGAPARLRLSGSSDQTSGVPINDAHNASA